MTDIWQSWAELSVINVTGWVASSLTLFAYSQKTMLPLRIIAIAAACFYIVFGWLAAVAPTLVLHSILLPFHLVRLWQILRDTKRARMAMKFEMDPIVWLRPYLKSRKLADGDYVFRKGDAPRHLYVLKSGDIKLEEIGVTLKPGEMFGEIAFFTDTKERTLSARCHGNCEILVASEADFINAYYAAPEFGLYMVRLVAQRLMDGISTNPEAYVPTQDQPS